MPTTQIPFIGRLYNIYQSIGQIISFQMMSPLRSFDDLDGKERGQKKTDDLRTMTTLGPRTLLGNFAFFLSFAIFFSKSTLSKNSFRNTIRVSNSLDPDQARLFVGPDLGLNCLQRL